MTSNGQGPTFQALRCRIVLGLIGRKGVPVKYTQLADFGTYVPTARYEGLIVTETQDDLLVYDQDRHHVHHLNPTAATIWRTCDGNRSINTIASVAGIDEDDVVVALGKLQDAGLLNDTLVPVERESRSRRSLLKKAGIAAAIVSVSAPTAAFAVSGAPCSMNSDCDGMEQCQMGICRG